MKGLPASDLPKMREVLGSGWHFLLPLALLIYLLVLNISPSRVGYYAILAMLLVASLRYIFSRLRHHEGLKPLNSLKNGIMKIMEAFISAAKSAIPVSIACAVSGIVVGIIGLTGLGLKFSSLMMSLSQRQHCLSPSFGGASKSRFRDGFTCHSQLYCFSRPYRTSVAK
ncbi:MAG: DUF1435 family protein [Deinococcales bacterium]